MEKVLIELRNHDIERLEEIRRLYCLQLLLTNCPEEFEDWETACFSRIISMALDYCIEDLNTAIHNLAITFDIRD